VSVGHLAPSEAAGWRRGRDVRPSSADFPWLSLQSSFIANGRECSGVWQGGQREPVTHACMSTEEEQSSGCGEGGITVARIPEMPKPPGPKT
jgi:hypothetical protein